MSLKKLKRAASLLLAGAVLLCSVPAFAAETNKAAISHNANNSREDAVTVRVNAGAYTGNLESADTENYYKFTINSDGYINVDFGKEYDSRTACGWTISISDSANNYIVGKSIYCGNTDTESTCKVGLSAGTYYLRVGVYNSAEYWTNVGYNFKINFTSTNVWETEVNDTLKTADEIPTDNTYYGSLRASDDIDYYKLTTTEKGILNIDFGKESQADISKAWDVVVFDAGSKELLRQDFYGGSTTSESSCKLGVPEGTYYIGICTHEGPSFWSDVTYRFKVNFTKDDMWESEINGEPAYANEISEGKTYYGALSTPADEDYYMFTLSEPSSVYLNFGSDAGSSTSGGWGIDIFNASLQTQQNSRHQGGAAAQTETFPSVMLPKGIYYIRVNASNGWSNAAYHFSLSERFSDIPSDAYYVQAVDWAVEKKITKGTSETTFSPDDSCTRGQIVTMLWQAMGAPEPSSTKNPFSDVKQTHYFYKPVLWAVENGITSGTTDTTFSPNTECTRAQAMTFLWNAMGKPSTLNDISFTDVDTDDYFYKPVRWAVKHKVTKGTSDTTFSPKMTCTRAQIITFLYNAMA